MKSRHEARALRHDRREISLVLILFSAVLGSCKGSDTPGGGFGGQGGTGSIGGGGGQGGLGGIGGGGGAGQGGAAGAPEQTCHTNRDCPTDTVCMIHALIGDCRTSPAGRCVPFDRSCSLNANNSDRCDCLGALDRDVCADEPSYAVCGGPTGANTDYASPDRCFGCYRTSCEINGMTISSEFNPLILIPFTGGTPCGDGCNSCWCTRQGVVSTLIGCAGGAPGGGGAGGQGGGAGAGGDVGGQGGR